MAATKRQLRERWKEEPGVTIRQALLDVKRAWEASKLDHRNGEELFALLDGLPFRDDVPNGRDFRGLDFAGGWKTEYFNTDFSYCGPGIGDFRHCDLSGAKFDEASAESAVFHKVLRGASFRRAKLRSCHFTESDVRNCCFDKANLYSTRFSRADLSGSSFRDANCDGVVFANAILLGCDFRGANLQEASFHDAKIDKTTDFRGASLINAYHDDRFDRAGNLIGRGVDLKSATYDETTKFGKDKLLEWIGIWDAIIEVGRRDYGQDGAKIAAAMEAIKAEQLRSGYSDRWDDDLTAALDDRQRELYEQVKADAYKSLL